METKIYVKRTLLTGAQKKFIRNIKATIRKPFSSLPKTSELTCKLNQLGSTRVISIYYLDSMLAEVKHFKPVINRDIRN